jgi:O-antigen/teichoic acid export membrane protein
LFIIGRLVSFGGFSSRFLRMVEILLAPTDFILINDCSIPSRGRDVRAPRVQIDGGLHLLVIGLASVLLPKTAVAYAAGDRAEVRTYYVRGTLTSVARSRCPRASMVWLLSSWIFKLWLGDPMDATRAILPFGPPAQPDRRQRDGRAVWWLLAIGKVGPYSVSVLAAGVANVILSFVFVKYCGLGLYGIVLGTICAVVGRALLWLPWYVMRTLRARPI